MISYVTIFKYVIVKLQKGVINIILDGIKYIFCLKTLYTNLKALLLYC